MRGEVRHLRDHPAGRGDRGDQREACRPGTVSSLAAAAAIAGRSASSSAVVVAAVSIRGGAGGGEHPPGVGGAEDGDAHERGHFQQAAEAVEVELVVLRAARSTMARSSASASPAGLDAEEVLGGGRPPLGQTGGGHRRPARLERAVEQVAVAEVLDQEAVRVAPVVEDLAALDVPADAPRPPVAPLAQVLAAGGQRVEVGDLVGRVHVAVGRAEHHRERVVVGGRAAPVAADEAHDRARARAAPGSRGSR